MSNGLCIGQSNRPSLEAAQRMSTATKSAETAPAEDSEKRETKFNQDILAYIIDNEN